MLLYNARGHKLRIPTRKKAQFVTVTGISSYNILGMEAHCPEGLSGSTMFFEETFGTFPLSSLKGNINVAVQMNQRSE